MSKNDEGLRALLESSTESITKAAASIVSNPIAFVIEFMTRATDELRVAAAEGDVEAQSILAQDDGTTLAFMNILLETKKKLLPYFEHELSTGKVIDFDTRFKAKEKVAGEPQSNPAS